MDIGLLIIIILTILFIFSYMVGKRKNIRIQRKIWRELSPVIKDVLSIKKIFFRGLGSSAFQLLAQNIPIKSLEKLEFTIILLDRENILHYLIQKIRHKTDEILLKADSKYIPNVYIEMTQKQKEIQPQFVQLNTSIFSNKYIYTDNPDRANKILTNIQQNLTQTKDLINHMLISSESPHIMLRARYDKDRVKDLIELCIKISRIFKK